MQSNPPHPEHSEEETEREVTLAGGNVNGAVVRVSNTVRRATNACSPTVHSLLRHLQAAGFQGCPQFLGLDAQGREVLTFLPGETGFLPYLWEGEAPLVAAAQLLRAYHDATLGYAPPEGSSFPFTYPDPTRHEVICHNDFAPYNLVCDPLRRVPYAVIDFDMAGPGPRLRDIAYTAYWLVPLAFGSPDLHALALTDLNAGSPRLHLFCDTYGVMASAELLEMIDEVLQFLANWLKAGAQAGEEVRSRMVAEGHLANWIRAREAYQEYRPALQANLPR
jgi:hypothetical protein